MKKDWRNTTTSLAVTAIALAFALAHAVCPRLGIDWVSLGFVGLATLPWLTQLFKSFEIAGLVKAEIAEHRADAVKLIERATEANLLAPPPVVDASQAAVNDSAMPLQALVMLRVQVDRLVKQLARVPTDQKTGAIRHLNELLHTGIITMPEFDTIKGLIVTLNRAVHGEHLADDIVAETLDVGDKIVRSLTDRLVDSMTIEELAEHLKMTREECVDYVYRDENVTGLNYHINATRSEIRRLPMTIANRLIARRRAEMSTKT